MAYQTMTQTFGRFKEVTYLHRRGKKRMGIILKNLIIIKSYSIYIRI